MLDFYNYWYASMQHEEHSFLKKMRIYSVLRFFIRVLANITIPIYYVLTVNNKKYSLSSGELKSERIIVTLTSFPARINRLWLVIESLLRQSHKPDMIILWLSKDQFSNLDLLPKSLLKLRKRGLQIFLREGDLRSYKKFFYTLSEYPNDVMITVDDDIFYPTSAIEELLKESLRYSCPVVVSRYFSAITQDNLGNCLPYIKWKQLTNKSRDKIFFGSGGGTLFPPGVLYKDVCNIGLFQRLAPFADDIWLNVMC